MFVGITSDSRRERGLALGVEYERRLNKSFGIGLVAEYAYEVGEWEISPQLDWDFVNGEQVLVLGVLFGKGF